MLLAHRNSTGRYYLRSRVLSRFFLAPQARTTFFEYYRQLARQQYTIGKGKAGETKDTAEEELESLRTDQREETEFFRDQDAQEEAEAQLKRSRTAEQHELLMSLRGENKQTDEVSFAKKPLLIVTDTENTWVEYGLSGNSPLPHDQLSFIGGDDENKKPLSRRTHFQNQSTGTQSCDAPASITHNTTEERRLLWKHLAEMPTSMEPSRPSTSATGGTSPRPLSARSKFLLGTSTATMLL